MICDECHREAVDPVKPGPAWSWCCRACFAVVDQIAEALEHGVTLDAPELALESPSLRLVRHVQDFTGRRFGRLLVLERVVVKKRSTVRQAWRVRCDCAREVVMLPETLRRGATRCHPCAVSDANRLSRRGIVARLARRQAA